MTLHTPTPWTAWKSPDGKWVCRTTFMDGDYRVTAFPAVCDAGAQDNEANAAFIVKAVNAHDELVSTLEWVRANYASGPTAEINARIDAALAKAS